MCITDTLNYIVLVNILSEAFQALWMEIILDHKKNIVCGIFHRQHNSAESFQIYLDEAVAKYILHDKPVVQLEILSIPNNKAHVLYSCPTRILKSASVSSLIF